MTHTLSTAQELDRQFGVPGIVRVETGRGSLAKIAISGDLASAEIYLHGAHVTQFQPRGAAPVLFLSKSSWFDSSKPIRGGVPLVVDKTVVGAIGVSAGNEDQDSDVARAGAAAIEKA